MTRAALKNKSVCIEKYVEKQIEIKTHQFIKKNRLFESDYEDIAQLLRIKIERRLKKFDPNLSGFTSFVHMIIKRELSHLLQKLYAKKRGRKKTVYIEDIITKNKELGTNSCSEFFCFEDMPYFLTEDLNDFLNQLPKELRIVCELLKEENILSASKILGVSRGSLRNDIKKIRKFFNSKGIKKASDFL